MTSVTDLVDEQALHALVPDADVFTAGEELAATAEVTFTEFGPLRVLAEVDDGGGAANVELALVEGSLAWSCDCSEGIEGRACRHFVAAALETFRRGDEQGA